VFVDHSDGNHERAAALMTIRVILGEDNFLAREGIERALERVEEIELVGSYGDLEAVLEAVEELKPDVVLTDIRMPPSNTDEGIRLARALRSSHPGVGVVVLSQHAEAAYALALLEEGSDRRAYLLKDRLTDREELSRAVRTVTEGGSVVDAAVVEGLLKSRREREDARLDTLTPRELEILEMIAEGRSNAAIADALVVTKRAVERHINGIFMKLDLGESEDVSRRVKAALLYLSGMSAST
jgi:DNA-binding NarL/FixJ family response regulator